MIHLCLWLFLLVAGHAQFVTAENSASAIQLLRGQGHETRTDASGFKYQIFYANQSPVLQSFVDSILVNIMSTGFGRTLCQETLRSNVKQIQHHVGTSPQAAREIARNCGLNFGNKNPWVASSNNFDTLDESKFTTETRRYIIIVTNQPQLPFGSWTESFNNTTVIMLHDSPQRSEIQLRYLTQILSHELAIHFDTKVWPFSSPWQRTPDLSRFILHPPNPEEVGLAALNPTLAPVLAFIRAFKVEKEIMAQLAQSGKLGREPIYYYEADYPFLKAECDANCLAQFILAHVGFVRPILIPVLGLSPHYRTRKLDSLRKSANEQKLDLTSYYEVLEQIPVQFMSRNVSDLYALDLVMNIQSPEAQRKNQMIDVFFSKNMTPKDFELLQNAHVTDSSTGERISFLTFLAQPFLGVVLPSMANSPRPRIRTGSTK